MLHAGKYYIGDPCYVLNEEIGVDWMKLLRETRYFNLYATDADMEQRKGYVDLDKQNGEFCVKGNRFAVSSTAHGDGCYECSERDGPCIGVDAGVVSAIPLNLVKDHPGVEDGIVVDMLSSFTVDYVDGTISFGHVEIYTNWPD